MAIRTRSQDDQKNRRSAWLRWWLIIPLLLIAVYLLGPEPSMPELDNRHVIVPSHTEALEKYVQNKESIHKLRPDTEARIVWANDSAKQRTEYCILYLHGFTASQGEGDPLHTRIASKFGCNLYLARLAEHGLDTTEQLLRLKAEDLWESAKEAYSIASALGKKVIIMGTSTGATLALMLAARNPEVHSLLLFSPNVEIFDPNAWILNNPWGLHLARMITGSNYIYSSDTRPEYKQYWSWGYRIEALVELEELLEEEMNEQQFKKISQPVLMLYYFKDQVHQDSVVRVDAMLKMFDQLGTRKELKRAVPMPKTGDHVLGSSLKSKDVEGVIRETEKFMKEVLKMKEK